MEMRKLGRTGESVSVVGFGGIAVSDETPDTAARLVDEAIDRGVGYFDVSPTYGNAEERLGPALKPYRDKCFLACKTIERKAAGAAKQIEESLRRLQTDRFDLYQLHGVAKMEDVKTILSPGGALEMLVEARRRGLARFIGFSAHTEEAALALIDAFDFDTVMFPINYVSWLKGNFGARVVDAAQRKGMGVIALKALGRRRRNPDEKWPFPKCWYMPVESYEEASLALRFTMSKGPSVAIGPGHAEFLWWACDAAKDLSALTPVEEARLLELASGVQPIFPK